MISKIKAIEWSFVVLALIVLSLVLMNKSSITGFVTSDAFSQEIDIIAVESQAIALESLSQKSVSLSSLRVSGEVVGKGLAEIYITDGFKKWLVFSNLQKKKAGLDSITGALFRIYEKEKLDGDVILPDGYETTTGAFNNACVDSCLLDSIAGSEYILEIWLQSETNVRLTELKYTIRE